MDRRCFGCASKFSVFKKECGCKSCGHSYCAGCLGFTAVLPQHGKTKQKICKKCHDTITSGVSPKNNSGKWSPPENYKKRLAALEAKQNQTRDAARGPGGVHVIAGASYHGLSKEDRAIAERLERLRQETKPRVVSSTKDIESRLEALRNDPIRPVPSAQEMEDRLAVLQGRTPPSRAPRPAHQPPDTRSQVQKADDLLTQMKDEVSIDQTWDPPPQIQDSSAPPMNDLSRVDGRDSWTDDLTTLDPAQLEEEKSRLLEQAAAELREDNTREEKLLEIGKRLAVLQGRDPDKVTLDDYKMPDSDDEETEEESIQRLLKQLSEEAVLDEACGFNIPPDQSAGAPPGMRQPAAKVPPQNRAPAVVRAAPAPKEPDSDEEELPWCCICNNDAVLRCLDCDNDLYCKRCFREGHDEFDRKEHRTTSYRPLKKKSGK
ncbi:abscission/NoCut checkpoint regulator isoform 2-T3 [Discoglossus pictus]